uniref:Seven TM Receptor n=1 Tax=Caenorhabditis tropicalis TaxID=1561998 RepID=A0A1I7UE40_9PELO
MIGLEIEEVAIFIPVTVAIYPFLEPMVAIYCIKDFRLRIYAVYCSCYAMMLSLLSIHFFYRYTSVTAPTYLPIRFSLKSSAFWAFFVALYSSVWGSASYFLCGPTENKDRELAEEFQRAYCLDPSGYAYVGPQYFYETTATGKPEFHLPSFLGIGVLAAQMSATFACVIWFGYKTYSTLSEDGITCFARKELQRQLFQTLVVQTIIPTVFMYLPVSCMFIFPMFGVRIEAMANLIPISVAIYPCFEPLVAMVLINDFRKRVYGLLNCRLRVNRISTLPTSNTWNSMYNAPN